MLQDGWRDLEVVRGGLKWHNVGERARGGLEGVARVCLGLSRRN